MSKLTHMQRVSNAIARIQSTVAGLVSGGEIDAEKAKTAAAQAKLEASDREKEQMAGAVEQLADDIDPPAAPAEAQPEEEQQQDDG